jgi:hypothetical protein
MPTQMLNKVKLHETWCCRLQHLPVVQVWTVVKNRHSLRMIQSLYFGRITDVMCRPLWLSAERPPTLDAQPKSCKTTKLKISVQPTASFITVLSLPLSLSHTHTQMYVRARTRTTEYCVLIGLLFPPSNKKDMILAFNKCFGWMMNAVTFLPDYMLWYAAVQLSYRSLPWDPPMILS